MSLFGSIHLAANALSAQQTGLHVVGNNLANINTSGYIRQEVIFQPGPPHRLGNLILGTGVEVQSIVQKIDQLLAERLRGATSDLANSEAQQSTYTQLEVLLGELGDSDLSTSLSSFFGSLNDLLNQPEDGTIRKLVLMRGKALADNLRKMGSDALAVHEDLNKRIANPTDRINGLLRRIAELNRKIVTIEGGGSSRSDAVGLRDERQNALSDLALLLNIQTIEQPSGSVNVFTGGDYLVQDGIVREVTIVQEPNERGLLAAEVRIAEIDLAIPGLSGQLAGLVTARDEIVGGFLDRLNEFTRTLIFEFNKIHSRGQGLTGYTSLTSEFAVEDATAALDAAGLAFAPSAGSFQVQVLNKQTGLTQTTDIFIDLDGLDGDTTLAGLAATLDNITGISASITASGKLTIGSDSPAIRFTFAGDTSGVLAALGLNTFFSGSHVTDISIRDVVRNDPTKLATSRNGIGADTQVLAELAAFSDAPLASNDALSLSSLYDQLVGTVTQGAAVTRAAAEGFRTFKQSLESQHLSISGVNLDEEAVKMIAYQRAFQASARLISTISQLLDVLVNL